MTTTDESENTAHEIVDDNRKNDDGDTEEVSPLPESEKGKGKEKSTSSKEDDSLANEDGGSDGASGSGSTAREGDEADAFTSQEPQPWQAVFAPQYNAYYFYNNQTGETTWTNPLQPSPDSASSSSAAVAPNTSSLSTEQGAYSDLDTSEHPSSTSPSAAPAAPYTALEAAALAQGIDPSLAHLDPALVTATTSASGGPIPTFQAKFNARTGAFTRPDARTPGHLSEYERMKRMSQFYFDVSAWEQQVADDKEEEEVNGKKRKRPTKKDLVCFLGAGVRSLVLIAFFFRNGLRNRRSRRRLRKRLGCGHSDLQ